MTDFVRESNRIEGIHREPYGHEIDMHFRLLAAPVLTVSLLCEFVALVQPGAVLRDQEGLDVRIGRHIAPRGGPGVRKSLDSILTRVSRQSRLEIIGLHQGTTPHSIHCMYEELHPFTDGNGRSGRAIWLWQMDGLMPLGFLHTFYYQTLDANRGH